jgi:hypothetical protein
VAHNRDKFDCANCRFHRHCDERNPASFPMFAIPEIGLESRTCLLPMITPGSRALLGLYTHYKNGLLPFSGGVLDQPGVFGEAMELIESQIVKLKATEHGNG